MVKVVLPGHKYIGPGNDVKEGVEKFVCASDRIAYKHDLAYSFVKNSEDVRAADRLAIGEFFDEFSAHLSWCSAVGVVGLSAKYALESLFGVQYPDLTKEISKGGMKRVGDERRGTSVSTKKKRGEGDSTAAGKSGARSAYFDSPSYSPTSEPEPMMEEDVIDSPVAEGGGGGRTTAGSAIEAKGKGSAFMMFKCPTLKSYSRTFYKEHNLLLWGNMWKAQKYFLDNKELGKLICTSYADFPVNYLAFYMSASDYKTLPSEGDCFVKNLNVSIFPMGETTSFLTGSTLSGSASAYHFLHGAFAIGLNRVFPTQVLSIKLKDGSMEVDSLSDADLGDLRTKLYGEDNSASTSWLSDFPCSQKHFRDFNLRTSIVHPGNTNTNRYKAPDSGQLNLTPYVHDFNWMKAKDESFTYNYKPSFGLIKAGRHYIFNGLNSVHYMTASTTPPTLGISQKWNADGTNVSYTHDASMYGRLDNTTFDGIDQVIEKNDVAGCLNQPHSVRGAPPSLSFGLYPTRSNTPASENETVNSAVYSM